MPRKEEKRRVKIAVITQRMAGTTTKMAGITHPLLKQTPEIYRNVLRQLNIQDAAE